MKQFSSRENRTKNLLIAFVIVLFVVFIIDVTVMNQHGSVDSGPQEYSVKVSSGGHRTASYTIKVKPDSKYRIEQQGSMMALFDENNKSVASAYFTNENAYEQIEKTAYENETYNDAELGNWSGFKFESRENTQTILLKDPESKAVLYLIVFGDETACEDAMSAIEIA